VAGQPFGILQIKGTPLMNANNKPVILLAAAIAALFTVSLVVTSARHGSP
jgi:hypothetical protein